VKTFRGYVADFKKGGHHHAAEFLQHFMDGTGTKKNFTREQARNFKPIRDGEIRIRKNFEFGTFLGETKNTDINEKLKGLQEGPPVTITDKFDVEVGIGRSLLNIMTSGTGFYKAFGLTEIKSVATFTANRVGNIIYIEGTIDHHWTDTYDFKKWQLAAAGALTLQQHRGAKPFDFGAKWKQKFSGTVDISNRVLSNPKFKWRDVEMGEVK